MSAHLPECEWNDATRMTGYCICNRLRACEQRMEASNQGFADMASFELGKREERKRSAVLIADAYAAGLDAARDAVAECRVPWPTATGDLVNEGIDDALAAIDALRGES